MQTVSEQKMRAWEAFLLAHARLVPLLERELQQTLGMPLNYYDVLLQLNRAPGRGLRQRELHQRVVLSQPALSRLVDRMAVAGLVAKEADPADRRGCRVCLTPAGLAALKRAAPVHLAGIGRHFARQVTDSEASAISEALERVIAAAERRL